MDVFAETQTADFDRFRVDLKQRSLSRIDETGACTLVALGARAFDILALLVSRSGELVTKTDIMDAVWPGIVVEDSNLTVQMSALRRVLGNGRDGPGCIQTVPGRGYRFVADVMRSSSAPPDCAAKTGAIRQPTDTWLSWSKRHRLILAALLVLFIATTAGLLRRVFHADSPARFSTAVLPFATDPTQPALATLANGLSENLTMDLNRLWAMPVASHQATLRFANQAFDARKTGRALDVRYLVEGSIHAANDRVVVHADVVSGETGKAFWTDQTEWPAADFTAAQTHAGSWLQTAIGNAVIAIEAARSARERPNNPDSTDLVVQAEALFALPSTAPRISAIRELLERALRENPGSYKAMTLLVAAIISNETDFGEGVGERDIEEAERLTATAESIAPLDPTVLFARAYLLRLEQRWPEAQAAFEHMISLYPHAHHAAFELGICRLYTGDAADAVPLFEQAVLASAGKGDLFSRYIRLGEAFMFAGRYEEAIPWLRKAEIADLGRTPANRAMPHLLAAAALALTSHIDAARTELAQFTTMFPYASASSFWALTSGTDTYAAQIDHVRHGLLLAGLRPHIDEDVPAASVPPAGLPPQYAGLTPKELPGGSVIRTDALIKLLADPAVVVLDGEIGQLSLPGAISLPWVSRGGAVTDDTQPEFGDLLTELTKGDKARPIVTLGLNAYQWPGYNLALRAVALGYRNVFWYRGGRDAWAVAGQPMTPPRPDPLMEP